MMNEGWVERSETQRGRGLDPQHRRGKPAFRRECERSVRDQGQSQRVNRGTNGHQLQKEAAKGSFRGQKRQYRL